MSKSNQDKVFIYWDNSNIYHAVQSLAEEQDDTPGARYLVRIHFENILRLAHADRNIGRAVAAGSIPPEMVQLWNSMENMGVAVKRFERGAMGGGEQGMPDHYLQKQMLEDVIDNNGNPGIAVLLTGDGAGYYEGEGFHSTLERMHKQGWRVEILSWTHACKRQMREWAETNGIFVALDDFYESVTFRAPSNPGHEFAEAREQKPLDLTKRKMSR